MIVKIRFGKAAIFVVAFLLFQVVCGAAENWQVPGAPVRFQLKLTGKPTHPSAGYIAQLPDGGILRRNLPSPVVMTPSGRELPSYTLWDNPETGFSIVFADPGKQIDTVYVYMTIDQQAQQWNPQTGITPSGLLCVSSGQETMAAAQGLARLGRVDAATSILRKAGIPAAPVSIGGNETGRPRPCVFYLLCYVNAAEDGQYWIAPFTQHGASEIYVNGTKLVPVKRTSKWGGEGAWVDFKRGLQRVEVFQTAPANTPSGNHLPHKGHGGIFFLTWRTPKDNLDNKKMDKLETRLISKKEVALSGECQLQQAEYRDGDPMACAVVKPGMTFWFENEDPLILCQGEALTGGNPPDTVYTWTLPERAVFNGGQMAWLYPGLRDYLIKLTAKSGDKSSECTVPFFAFSSIGSSMNSPQDRALYRSTIQSMLEAFPAGAPALALCSDAYWNNLIRAMDYGEGMPVLNLLFTRHWEAVRKKLTPPQTSMLQDIFLGNVQRENPSQAMQWLDNFQQSTTDAGRRSQFRLQQAELQMYSLKDRKSAKEIFSGLASQGNAVSDTAKIRLGDLALLEGDLNKAIGFYADVQNRARARRNAPRAATGALVSDQLLKGSAQPLFSPPGNNAPTAASDKPNDIPNSVALQEVSLSENVKSLVEQGFFLEARQTLQVWENEFPLSKVSGDYIIRESEFYMKTKDWSRARPMLEAYCRTIDASSYLPEAIGMLISCVKESKEPREPIRDLVEKVKERLKYHPIAAKLDAFLAGK